MKAAHEFLSSIPRIDHPIALKPITAVHKAVKARGIEEKTCLLYDYTTGEYQSRPAQFANYRGDDGLTIAQHIRLEPKDFRWVRPKGAKLQLFGQHLGDNGTLVLFEGEIDAMTGYQAIDESRYGFRGQWVCASIPDGAQSAKASITKQLDWVLGFEKVVVFFDSDEPGRKAAVDVAELIGPKAAIVQGLPYKDANEAWLGGDGNAIRTAILGASRHRPSGVVHAADMLEQVLNPQVNQGYPLPWRNWDQMTGGLKPGELWLLSAGTGIGKSLLSRSIALNLCRTGTNVAYVGLEESTTTTLERMCSEQMKQPMYLRDSSWREERRSEISAALDQFAPNLFLLDKFGSEDFSTFVATIKHYVLNEECKVVFLDHFSLLADGIALNVDQRRAIDKCIKDLKTLCMDLGFTMFVVCHLSRNGGIGPSHEEGGEPTLAELRGSHSLAQIPDFIVMLSRNPLARTSDGRTDKSQSNLTTCWLKKNRVKGELGQLNQLAYDINTCNFHEIGSMGL